MQDWEGGTDSGSELHSTNALQDGLMRFVLQGIIACDSPELAKANLQRAGQANPHVQIQIPYHMVLVKTPSVISHQVNIHTSGL